MAKTWCYAILGPSGAGKSTLADPLVRFYDPGSGMIRLDGHDLRELSLAGLRESVVLLDQSPYLFQASVRENLAYGRSDATDAERGQTLSAESARIAIARAILANPKVLVLDEPTSALDEENERPSRRPCSRLPRGARRFSSPTAPPCEDCTADRHNPKVTSSRSCSR